MPTEHTDAAEWEQTLKRLQRALLAARTERLDDASSELKGRAERAAAEAKKNFKRDTIEETVVASLKSNKAGMRKDLRARNGA